jgi:23S rRNA pseudouridine1911/1915/1917 synthase
METNHNIDLSNQSKYIETTFHFLVPKGQIPERLDVFLTNSIKNATRSKVQSAIDAGNVLVNGKPSKASKKIQPNDTILCKILKAPPIRLVPENIHLNIIYEDSHLLLINKPAGMVSHPGFGNHYGTLINAVLYHSGMREPIDVEIDSDEDDQDDYPEGNINDEALIFASEAVRPGLVHRLDKDTTGLIVVSKNPDTHAMLAKQFEERTIDRYYWALAWGVFKEESGTIIGDIGRSSRDRKLFAVVKKGGKPSITDYTVLERFDYLTLLKVKLRTGRTHQIRVHLSHNNHPVFGDPSYGGDSVIFGGNNPQFRKTAEQCLKLISRQMLHAKTLGFVHPETNEKLSFESPLPEDFENVLNILRENLR